MKNNAQDEVLYRLKNFPVSFISVGLGLTGFTLLWQKAEYILKLPVKISMWLLYLAIAVNVFIVLMYTIKLIRYPSECRNEFRHPVKINFYPIIAKIFLIMSIIFLEINIKISRISWWTGVGLQTVFTFVIMSRWIHHDKYEITQINPAWFIPVVGLIIVPIAGIKHFSAELSWFFFSIGLFFWFALFVLVIYRVIFHTPLEDKLVPTFFILFAPPIIGFISLTKLTGHPGVFGNLLYYFGFFLFMLIIMQIKLFTRIKFYLSWWAYTFPLAAAGVGSLLMYHEKQMPVFKIVSWGFLILLCVIVLSLIFVTLKSVWKREICVEE